MFKVPVSCFIISKNEGDRIGRTIRSVRPWVDEVVVIDSESSDDTVSVALAEGCRVITQSWLGFGSQKRFGEDQCRNNWVFNLDADEVVTPQLAREIIAMFANGDPVFVAYGMPIQMVYPGATTPRPMARDHWYVRLYDRRYVRFRNSKIHDTVVTDEHPIGWFQAPVFHYSMRSFADMKRKLDERTWLLVENSGLNSKLELASRLLIELPMNFFKYYVVRRHCTGGLKGLRYAWIQARYRFLKIYRLWRSGKVRSGPSSIAA
ncbi:glycosyltransferase family 2 protein [Hyphomicrobium sp. 99]|uniref:glycosyltransferase family 2 protein n=1 Tax=Hyphomicrobium sp. 99 TaxID=1163419 RepID=UPI0005F81D73|nr:glycosyltransferase family 2 protein [Hyphomicrobium sp. 99]